MIFLDEGHSDFAREIEEASGGDFNRCLHCKTCANGCPFIEGMDYSPNKIIRLIQLGMADEALKSATIWVCVGCNTCSSGCPMAIDIPGIMDRLRHRALAKGVEIAEPDILNFHREVLNTVKKYGRTHKLEIMMRYKLKKRKLDLTPSKIQDQKAIEKIFQNT